jgi:phosphoribosylformimino-5-aminoimidazole carboxamide ribotide isomerase
VGVIDLKNGQAVHARGGRREAYAAVSEAAGVQVDGNPFTLARTYRDACGLTDLYVADLDAIAAGTAHNDVIRAIAGLGGTVCVDSGVTTPDDARRVLDTGANSVVVGLETLPSFDALRHIQRSSGRITFSLDLRDGVPMTTGALAAMVSPEEIARQVVDEGVAAIIVLDVARVGGKTGPDVPMLQRIRRAVSGVSILAGGGVRDLNDLKQLADVGCDGVLVATALHDGRLSTADVAAARAF